MPKRHQDKKKSRPKLAKHQHQQKCKFGFTNNFYYVEKILGTRILKDGRSQMFVSWEGWSARYNSWVFTETVKLAGEIEGQSAQGDENGPKPQGQDSNGQDNNKNQPDQPPRSVCKQNKSVSNSQQPRSCLKIENCRVPPKDKKQDKNAKKVQKQMEKGSQQWKKSKNTILPQQKPIKMESNPLPVKLEPQNLHYDSYSHNDLNLSKQKEKKNSRYERQLKKLNVSVAQEQQLNSGIQTRQKRFMTESQSISLGQNSKSLEKMQSRHQISFKAKSKSQAKRVSKPLKNQTPNQSSSKRTSKGAKKQKNINIIDLSQNSMHQQ